VLRLLPAALLAAGCGGGDRIESIESELRSVRKEVTRLREAQEAQATQLEAVSKEMEQVRKVSAEVGAGQESLERATDGLTERLRDTNARIDRLSARLGTSAPAEASMAAPTGLAPAAAAAAPPAQLYDQAQGDYTKGNYALALLQLQEFLSQYPDNDLADNAQFLLAEAYFAQKKYEDAIREYDKIFARYGKSDKIAAAYLKKGFAFLELAQTAQGVVQLQYLIGKFPKSDEAQVARRRLESMGLKPR
jgi:tol-pal system protein YbgF